ncbi:Holliday junction resolvase RecU [Ligilactobacillus cholophilus]|uniref:Holliday junction resolvase RecU n=1 Tax=Ligilactobacillus cholophilus TaxID=3050131 RepID=UPI0025AF730F|nr:Holliday junction resolvase RecU [Ligilactobacillus cholophilus]
MTFNYPNGKPYSQKKSNIFHEKHKSKIIYGNRGMSLEQEINDSNAYYLENEIAVIHKKPIPIQIVDVDYPKRSAAVIKKAYFKTPSTTDYNGIYRGYYLDFEAKETKNKTSFPLSNFHAHQIKHMKACLKQKGICFTIVRFVLTDELFLMPCNLLFKYWDNQQNERKSIPKSEIQKNSFKINYSLQPRIPYLKYVDLLIKQIEGEENEGTRS